MSDKLRAAAQAALEELIASESNAWNVINNLEAALAEQKPMLEMNPEKREWVGLTDEEIDEIGKAVIGFNSLSGWENEFGLAIETKLREKNK